MNFSDIRKEYIFWDVVYAARPDIDTSTLREEAYSLRAESEGVIVSNRGGWHSSLQERPSASDSFRELEEAVQAFAESVMTTERMDLRVKDLYWWININPQGGYNHPHNHPKTELSAVYYVSAPENCGNLVLARTDSATYANLYNNVPNGREFSITPREGDLLLFPGHLWHWVEPNSSSEDRISFTFNIECGR